jgi:trigger factor
VKVTAERIPESKVLLRIEIPPEEVQQSLDKTFRDLSRKIRVPGFRPGKAPRSIVERFLGGPEAVEHEGIDRLIDDSYRRALRETNTRPVGDPDLADHPEFHPGEPLVIEATVPVEPKVELGDYRSIRMVPLHAEATPDQVNAFLDNLREGSAEWVDVDRAAQDHDQVVIDVRGVAGTVPSLYGPTGEPLLQSEGGKEVFNESGHQHYLDVQGPIEFAPGFDEEIVGMRPESEKRFGLTLPADFRDANLANSSVIFDVKLHSVKEKHLPDLDDELAKKVAGVDTVEQLRDLVRARLQLELERSTRTAFENTLVDTLIERSTIEVPEVMVERQVDAMVEDLKEDLSRERVTWDEYVRQSSKSESAIRADLREQARKTLVRYLVLREVARQEGIQVSPQDVSSEIDMTAAAYGRARTAVRERLNTREQRDRIEFRLFYRRAVDRLADIATQPAQPSAAGEPEGAPEAAPTGAEAVESVVATAAPETAAAAMEESAVAETKAESADLAAATGASSAAESNDESGAADGTNQETTHG